MKNDIIKYIAILIVIRAFIWWLLYKDNNTSNSQIIENTEEEGVYSN